jgi:type II secretory pathway pseudopilin PulG
MFISAWNSLTSSDRIALFSAVFAGLSALAAIVIPLFQSRSAKKAMAAQEALSRKSADLAERSAKAAEQSAWAAKQGIMTGQRCWLNVEEVTVKLWNTPNILPSDVCVTIYNGGRTPAESVAAEIYLRFDDEFRPVYDRAHLTEFILGPLGPGTKKDLHLHLVEDREQKHVFIEGIIELYLYGQIQYEDVFGDRHLTSFGYCFNRTDQRFQATKIHNHMSDYARPDSEEDV